MTAPCRLVHAHVHVTIPRESMYVARLAREDYCPPGMRLVRTPRWLTVEREWQACYVPKGEN